ncbi:unnamed protein product [Mytilus coruscus]|uniref:Uncharacterized protein n=1 Tax=Mytilus coruscus TaxID=42192 RepID=A0A6J8ASG7_MYTCO|nr:unnamed protein product [Mytilus coruscus]
MQRLEIDHPDVYRYFKAGHHVLRMTDRFWSGLSTDLTIEQILMRSVKSSGGLTRGRGMGESQRAQWILSMPACADYNSAMQDLTGVGYCTSDQHKETTRARKERDRVDTLAIREYLSERNPLTNDVSLRNIKTGVQAEPDVNVDKAETKPKSKSDSDFLNTDIDPQLMFQRLTTAANGLFENTSEVFQYELSSVPSSMFDCNRLLREACKSNLADAIWEYKDPVIVFDSFPELSSIKDITHLRRTKGIISPNINFTSSMPCKTKKELFMSNNHNKQALINMLCDKLKDNDIRCKNATDDADLLIAQTAVDCALSSEIVVIGCDSTSRLYGIGKGLALKKLNQEYLKMQGKVFMNNNPIKAGIIKAGEEALACLYGGRPLEGLNILRWRKFTSRLITETHQFRFENKLVMKFYTMESKVVTSKERLGSTLKRYGAIQILLGLGCLIITFVSIGINKKVCDNLGKKDCCHRDCSSLYGKKCRLQLDKNSSIMATSLFVPIIVGAATANFILKKDKQVRSEQFVDNEKQMTELELPEYQP